MLRFTPTISFTNLGFDNNVFNEAEDPKRDNTGAVGPEVALWMRLGPSRLSGTGSVQYLYFEKYHNQRALNTGDELKWELPLSRITPFVSGNYSNTRTRPGYEIDSRARQQSQLVKIGSEVRLSGKSTVVVSGSRGRVEFDEDETFLGVDLAKALNRVTTTEELQLRYKLTSITTFVTTAQVFQERFTFAPVRDSNSIRILPGFEMKPSALISGRAFVGYRQFDPLDGTIPDYRGLIAAVDAKYVLRATQVGAKVGRDLTYSYQGEQPYYQLTDLGLTITQRLTYTWDVVVRGGRQTLDYKQVRSVLGKASAPQFDTVHEAGAGIGYRFGRTLRVGIDGIYYRRRSSNVLFRDYDGTRVGASFTYGQLQ